MTNRHEKFINQHKEQVLSYLYDEMTADEAQSFERHLKECSACQKDAEDFRVVRQALTAWQLEDVPHIALRIEPRPAGGWLDLLRAWPVWTRLVASAAAAMLLLAIFNVQISYTGSDGFQFRASLLPRSVSQNSQPGLTQEQTVALIQAIVQQDNEQRQQEVAAAVDAMAKQLKAEHQQMLVDFAKALRREQRQQLVEYWDTGGQSYGVPTLADLFSEDSRSNR
jgi:hypothetical protein